MLTFPLPLRASTVSENPLEHIMKPGRESLKVTRVIMETIRGNRGRGITIDHHGDRGNRFCHRKLQKLRGSD